MTVLTSDVKGKGTGESVVKSVTKKAQTRGNYKESKNNNKHENHPKEARTTLTNIVNTIKDRKDDVIETSNYSKVSNNTESKHYGTSSPEIDPFTNRLEISNLQILQIVLCSLTLAPLRILCILILGIFMWIITTIGIVGISDEELNERPITGWRRKLRFVGDDLGRFICFCMGLSVTKVGSKCCHKEAPIFVAAPHSTIIDIIAAFHSHASCVAKDEIKKIPLFSSMARFGQCIFVERENKEARKIVAQTIISRAKNQRKSAAIPSINQTKEKENVRRISVKRIHQIKDEDETWTQTLIFPEGTVTNRKGIINFKLGAFNPGVPVQPVILRPLSVTDPSSKSGYRNNRGLDTLTWTHNNNIHPSLLFWFTLCQFRSHFVIEFLPVYSPNSEEKVNPRLFANNMRRLISKHLSMPLVDKSLEDIL